MGSEDRLIDGGTRRLTSHERRSGQPWDASYRNGPAPWDIGRPQPAVVRLGSEGRFAGTVLDAGCGTGENALHIASLGLPVLGVDVAETALAIARANAEERGIAAGCSIADCSTRSTLTSGANMQRTWPRSPRTAVHRLGWQPSSV